LYKGRITTTTSSKERNGKEEIFHNVQYTTTNTNKGWHIIVCFFLMELLPHIIFNYFLQIIEKERETMEIVWRERERNNSNNNIYIIIIIHVYN